MLEALLDMDSKGIIVPDYYGLHSSYQFVIFWAGAFEYLKTNNSSEEIISNAEAKLRWISNLARTKIPSSVTSKIRRNFNTDISWVPLFSADPLVLTRGVQLNYKLDINSIEGVIPYIVYTDADRKRNTYLHESIHLIRNNILPLDKAFEEAFANYYKWLPRHSECDTKEMRADKKLIKQAERKLWWEIGGNAGYVAIRLNKREIMQINKSSKPLECLKEWKCVRHQVMKERLGL